MLQNETINRKKENFGVRCTSKEKLGEQFNSS
jgi:hypothetical protein